MWNIRVEGNNKINYSDLIELGFKRVECSDSVYYNQYGYTAPDVILIDGITNDYENYTEERNAGEIVGEAIGQRVTYSPDSYNIKNFDIKTFLGGLECCFNLLRRMYPDSVVIYVLPHKNERYSGWWEYMIDNAIKACEKWSTPVVDVYHDGLLNARKSWMRAKYTDACGTHQNTLGNEKFYVPMIMAEIRKHFM